MGGLKDQLLKAGIVDAKQVKQAQQAVRKEQKQQRSQGKPAAAEEERQRLAQAQTEKAERDRQLNRQRQEESEQRAVLAQIRQLVEAHRLSTADGDRPFNFTDGSTVKRLHVTDAVARQLGQGRLAIVKLEGRYEVVPAEVAEKIGARQASAVILHNAPSPATEPPTEDDPYRGFEVPDDLMW